MLDINIKKYTRREFITTLGSIAVAGVLLKFSNATQVLKAITSHTSNSSRNSVGSKTANSQTANSNNSKNTYGNNAYGGIKKV